MHLAARPLRGVGTAKKPLPKRVETISRIKLWKQRIIYCASFRIIESIMRHYFDCNLNISTQLMDYGESEILRSFVGVITAITVFAERLSPLSVFGEALRQRCFAFKLAALSASFYSVYSRNWNWVASSRVALTESRAAGHSALSPKTSISITRK